jgi:Uma2 family endonuclease
MILARTISPPKIGPHDHGRKMTLQSFEFAEVEDGCRTELARGYVVVSEVPNLPHTLLTAFIRRHLDHYHVEHPSAVYLILGTMECKLLIPDWESERHPDIAVYLSKPKGRKDRTIWRTWVPELVIEVVSESSRDRDYTQMRDEYWTLGVKESWIVDAHLKQVLTLRRGRSIWTEKLLTASDVCISKLLPGFRLPCRAMFDAAGEEE